MVSRAIAKQKGLFLSFLDSKDVAHFSSLYFSLFMTLFTFNDYVRNGPFSTGVSAASSVLEADSGRA